MTHELNYKVVLRDCTKDVSVFIDDEFCSMLTVKLDNSESADYYTLNIDEDIEDVIPYLFEKQFHTKYRSLGWWLEADAKDFVKNIENQYLANKLDLSKLYNDWQFLDYLKDKYKYLVFQKFQLNDDVYLSEDLK